MSWLGHVERMTKERVAKTGTVRNKTEGKTKSKMGRRCEE